MGGATGGAGVRLLTISDNFLIGGLETRVLTAAAGFAAHRVLAERLHPERPGAARVRLAAWRPEGHRQRVEGLLGEIAAFRPDVIDLHPFHALLTGLHAAAIAGVPALLHLHGPASLALPFAGWQERLLARLLDVARPGIIVVSEETRALAAARFPGHRLLLVPNGVCRETGLAGQARGRGRAIAIATRLDPDKLPGLLDLLDLAASAAALRLDIHGSGSAGPDLAAAVRRAGLGRRVRLHGAVERPARLYRPGQIVAGCGRSLLEGLAQGRRGLVVSAAGVVAPVSRAGFAALARANHSGRGIRPWPHRRILGWLERRATPADIVADLVPGDLPRRMADAAASAPRPPGACAGVARRLLGELTCSAGDGRHR